MNAKRRILTRNQVRELDRRAIQEFGVPGAVLMENAGRGVVDRMCEVGIVGPVVVFCGRGNNAGDGFVIARHLDLRGHQVQLIVAADESEYAGDAGLNYQIASRSGISFLDLRRQNVTSALPSVLNQAEWIVDAIVGTGATGDPRAPWDEIIPLLNAAAAKRLAVDIPTGLDCDSGEPGTPTVQADYTCTFVAAKPGLLEPNARRYVGELSIVDIGAPGILVEEMTAKE